MAYLNREQVKDIMTEALKSVADFSGDIENYSFSNFQDTQKQVFLTNLKSTINNSPYYNRDGSTSDHKYYDVPLSLSLLNSWQNMSDCIDYVLNNQTSIDK